MSRVKIFPNQNVQERFLITKPRVITSKCLVFTKLFNPFVPNAPSLYPMKTWESLTVS